jgi:hypothetical protein
MVHIAPANLSFYDCIAVKNWYKAKCDIEKIAQDHFAEQAKQERIAKARAELIAAGEFNNPVLDRYSNIDPFFTKIINNHFTPVS